MQVLIVEDDAALGLFLQKGLKLEGHEVSWVGDGEAALEQMQLSQPDLVVMDLSLQWNCAVLPTSGFSQRERWHWSYRESSSRSSDFCHCALQEDVFSTWVMKIAWTLRQRWRLSR